MHASPSALIEELHNAACGELAGSVVDAIISCGPECVPLLQDTIRGDADDCVLARALALLGEVGTPALLQELLTFFPQDSEDEDATTDSAEWAARRIAQREPAQALEVIREIAASADVAALYDLSKVLAWMPDTPGRREVLLAYGNRFADVDPEEREPLAATMAISAMIMEGAKGPLIAEVRSRYAMYWSREAEKSIQSVEQELIREGPFDPTADQGSIYDLACPGYEEEETGPFVRPEPKTGRNDPCWCGSGKKFKKCHGA
jgi:SEC-C motif